MITAKTVKAVLTNQGYLVETRMIPLGDVSHPKILHRVLVYKSKTKGLALDQLPELDCHAYTLYWNKIVQCMADGKTLTAIKHGVRFIPYPVQSKVAAEQTSDGCVELLGGVYKQITLASDGQLKLMEEFTQESTEVKLANNTLYGAVSGQGEIHG